MASIVNLENIGKYKEENKSPFRNRCIYELNFYFWSFMSVYLCMCMFKNFESALYTVSYCKKKISIFLYFWIFFKKILIDTEYFLILLGQNICKIL